jgi:hypothetical protein
MRLLNTATFTLQDFLGQNVPPYGILSHTWEEEEVLFADVQNGRAKSRRKGYAKVDGFCRKAAQDGFQWVWVDTCCIDKSSSAELSEAINSMYEWYRSSTICYVYLTHPSHVNRTAGMWPGKMRFRDTEISECRWFTRGWTLQELLAPRVVEFYGPDWQEIGTKMSLSAEISNFTGIPERILMGDGLPTCTVAERMSWASGRQTTREEDRAYSLLGLFDVNMPLLYGEGAAKSFLRLQEQILKQEEDYSLLAWTLQYDCGSSLAGVLASSPSEFAGSVPQHLQPPTIEEDRVSWDTAPSYSNILTGDFVMPAHTFATQTGLQDATAFGVWNAKPYDLLNHRPPSAMNQGSLPALTSRGLYVTLPLWKPTDSQNTVVAWIYCTVGNQLVCLLLRPVRQSDSKLFYARVLSPWLISVSDTYMDRFSPEEVLLLPKGIIEQHQTSSANKDAETPQHIPTSSSLGRLLVVTPFMTDLSVFVVAAYPANRWSLDEFFFTAGAELDVVGVLLCECHDIRKKYQDQNDVALFEVYCGIRNSVAWCSISEVSEPHREYDLEFLYEERRDLLSGPDGEPLSDRSWMRSDRKPNLIFTAGIRRRPAPDSGALCFTLNVGARLLNGNEPMAAEDYDDLKLAGEFVHLFKERTR